MFTFLIGTLIITLLGFTQTKKSKTTFQLIFQSFAIVSYYFSNATVHRQYFFANHTLRITTNCPFYPITELVI